MIEYIQIVGMTILLMVGLVYLGYFLGIGLKWGLNGIEVKIKEQQ